MSLNDLLPLLFVAFLVVNAILRGRRASKSGRAKERPDPPRPQDPSRRTAQAEPPGQRADEVGGDAGSDDLMRRIEEARRRVRESMGEPVGDAPPEAPSAREAARARRAEDARSAPGGAAGTAGPARAGAGSSRPRPAGGTFGTSGDPVPTPPSSAGFLGREGPPPTAPEAPRKAAKRPVTVARRPGPDRSARLRAAKGLGRDRDDIVRGFVWSVVLSEPVAHEMRRRRTVSPRRSP